MNDQPDLLKDDSFRLLQESARDPQKLADEAKATKDANERAASAQLDLVEEFKQRCINRRYLRYETRVRKLEAEGLTRSDAQGVAEAEGLDQPTQRRTNK